MQTPSQFQLHIGSQAQIPSEACYFWTPLTELMSSLHGDN